MKNLLNCLILVLFVVSCKPSPPTLRQEETTGLPPDFIAFYEKFHADSTFQMAHISFPLEGYPMSPDSATLANNFRWTADKWVMHRGSMFVDSLYTRRFDSPLPTVITEIIMQKAENFGTYRRFLKRDDSWYLIFYSDMNRIDSNN
ncbi:MAG: DUF4348 domain-containing protein [Saprospiraceae bacterium]|nr:DUF4348 domain-containing protein [Saprospiraceae bacterium]